MAEQVILVDEQDNPVGTMEKMEAHRKGLLHRAFSIFIFNDKDEMLIHQRAHSKYHSGGLWTNACCSHPREGETVLEAGHRRLQEEMGFDTELKEIFQFTYKAALDNELTEHEFDHVLVGKFNDAPNLNPEEVASYKYVSLEEIRNELIEKPEKYTEWFKIAFEQVEKHNSEKAA